MTYTILNLIRMGFHLLDIIGQSLEKVCLHYMPHKGSTINHLGRKVSISMNEFIIDREAREIMYLVASVRPSNLSRLNRLTYELDFWHGGRT